MSRQASDALDACEEERPARGCVILFPRPVSRPNQLTARDRMEIQHWRDHAYAAGYNRVLVENAAEDDQPELGDFVMVYRPGESWASWAVGCCSGGFTVWRPGNGVTVGWYPTIAEALDAVLQAPPNDGLRQRRTLTQRKTAEPDEATPKRVTRKTPGDWVVRVMVND